MQITTIQSKIHEIRGIKVLLDFDLAKLYQVPTKSLNLAVKRNLKRFPEDFMFQLTKPEWESLRFQIETLETGRGKYPKYLPYAFTEQGLAMLSGLLHSEIAIEMNISIMRAFVLIRQFALSHMEITAKLKELEKMYDQQFNSIAQAIDYLLKKDQVQVDQQNRNRAVGSRYR